MQAPGQHVGVLCFGQRDDVQEVVGNLDALDQVHQSLVGQKRIQIIRCHGSVIPAVRHGCDGPQPITYGGNGAFFRAWDASSRTTATRAPNPARPGRHARIPLPRRPRSAPRRHKAVNTAGSSGCRCQRRRCRLELRQGCALAQWAGIGEFQRSAVGRAAPAAEAVHEQRRQLGRRGEMEFRRRRPRSAESSARRPRHRRGPGRQGRRLLPARPAPGTSSGVQWAVGVQGPKAPRRRKSSREMGVMQGGVASGPARVRGSG